jgi:hypothetical protein
MIAWSGYDGFNFLNTGGRYNPATDAWAATTTMSAPEGRYYHTAIWTGREMIVWGGIRSFAALGTGGIYNPTTGTWTATSTNNGPSARGYHSAVWTGNEMVVWGGGDENGTLVNTGGDTIPVRIAGRPLAPPTHPLFDNRTRQSGQGIKWSSGAAKVSAAMKTPAADTARVFLPRLRRGQLGPRACQRMSCSVIESRLK